VSLLRGVTVVEVASVITGPYAGMILADLGADVVKVESLEGDQFRRWEGGVEGIRPAFAAYNRGKRSVALNLKDDEGRALFERLVGSADVVIENFRPGVMDRLGVGWDRLRTINPRLVYCYVSGMGTRGPDRDRPTFDAVAQALSGLWSQYTELSDPEPVGPPAADQLTGLYAAIAILAGLRHRDTTGEGTQVEVSMLAACLGFQTAGISAFSREDKVPTKTSRAHNSQSYAFVGSDGRPFAIHLSTPRKFWEGLCRTVGRADLIDDERYAVKKSRIRRYEELHQLFGDVFRTAPRAHWLELLARHDVPAAPINTVAEAVSHPQVEAIGIIDSADDVDEELRGLVRSPVAVEGRHLAGELPPPHLGAHASDVLGALGLSAKEIQRLRARGALG
jgi:crotonobetainyl-CoA:carnitine CoA-transferase CaiB-like acyl-CoA transferase